MLFLTAELMFFLIFFFIGRIQICFNPFFNEK